MPPGDSRIRVRIFISALCLLCSPTDGLEGATDESKILYWGDNTYGQAGIAASTYIDTPTQLFPSLNVPHTSISQIGCGVYTTLAMMTNGAVYGAGRNDYNPIMAGLPSTVSTPTLLTNMPSGVTHASSQANIGVVFDNVNHRAWMWGDNAGGKLGLGLSNSTLDYPVELTNYTNYDHIYVTGNTSYATRKTPNAQGVTRNLMVKVWGSNTFGTLGIGNNDTAFGSTPIDPTNKINVKFISGGFLATTIVTEDNEVLSSGHACCIGRDAAPPSLARRVPPPPSLPPSLPPPTSSPSLLNPQFIFAPVANIPTGLNIKSVVTSNYLSAILTSDGRVWSWGSGTGEWMSGTSGSQPEEIDFSFLLAGGDFIVQLHVLDLQVFAISQRGHIIHWGKIDQSGGGEDEITLRPQIYGPLSNYFVSSFLFQNPLMKSSGNTIGACAIVKVKTTNCIGTPPSTEYVCAGGIWTAINPVVSVPTVIISNPLIVDGALSTESVTFQGSDSSISVGDCFYSTNVEIDLTNPSLGVTSTESGSRISIVNQSSSCGDTLANSMLNVKTNDKSCRKTSGKLELEASENGRSLYAVVFKVNNNACNTWWIILASVIGGLLLVVIVAVVLVSFVTPIKKIVRPFWIRSINSS